MKKIAIVTINDPVVNYGNKLQNYASVRIYKIIGCEPYTLLTEKQKSIFSILGRYLIGLFRGKNYCNFANAKNLKFKMFDKKYLEICDCFLKKSNKLKDFDFFSVGSDQVWNPTWYSEKKEECFMLKFCDNNKKIALSPSFGIEKLPEVNRIIFKKYISSIPFLSVREESGARIIKELTGKNAEVLIDPTLALNRDEWSKISKKPRKFDNNNKYILTYFLSTKNQLAENMIKKIKIKNPEYEVRELLNEDDCILRQSDPCEFLYLIENSAIVLTDSFHACVFSFIFNRPFVVFDRNWKETKMSTRIISFLDKFKIDNKYCQSELEDIDIWSHNYKDGYLILDEERKKLFKFLKHSLKISTEN